MFWGIHIEADWSRYQNVTDSGVLDEIITKHQITASRSLIHRQVESRYLQLIRGGLFGKTPDGCQSNSGSQRFY